LLFFSILMIYLIFGLIISESVGISAISTQNYDSFDIFFENFSIFNTQIYRFLAYKIITIIISIFGALILFSILFIIVNFINMFLNLEKNHILFVLTYLISITYGISIIFVSDLISYLIFVYKRDNFDLSKLEPEILSDV